MQRIPEKIDGSRALPWTRAINGYTLEYTFELEEQGLIYRADIAFEGGDTLDVTFVVFDPTDENLDAYEHIDIGFAAAVKVLHTIYAAIKDALNEFKGVVQTIKFAAKADDESRVKFYRTLAKQVADEFGQGAATIDEQFITAGSGEPQVLFTITKKRGLRERIDGSRAVPYRFKWMPPSATATFLVTTDIDSPGAGSTLKYVVYMDNDEGYLDINFATVPVEVDDADDPWNASSQDDTVEQIPVGFKTAMQVFHTVWAVLVQYFDETEHDVDVIAFSASQLEPSRVKFYHALAKQVAQLFETEYDTYEAPGTASEPPAVYFEIPANYEAPEN